MQKSNVLVNFETNKYIHGSYHHDKHQEIYNLDRFLSLINSSSFKEHKDFNEITDFFPLSLEILSKAIIEELEEKGYKKRLEVFFQDLRYILEKIKCVLPELDISELWDYFNQTKKYSLSKEKSLSLARGAMLNFKNCYVSVEKEILTIIMKNLSNLVENNYRFLFGKYYCNQDEHYNNINEQKITKYMLLLYSIIMSKNITKKEIVNVFKKLIDRAKYLRCKKKTSFLCDYPHEIDCDRYKYEGYCNFDVCNHIEKLHISDRFDKFIDIFYQEIECFYIFQILNTELYQADEIVFGDITYYNEKIYKSKGWRNIKSEDEHKENFGSKEHIRALLGYKTKKYFPNVSFLEARKIVENNTSILKLLGNRKLKENVELFKPDVSKMDVSYSYYILDENCYMIGSSHTVYDGNFSFEKNTIYSSFFKDKVYMEQFDIFVKQINNKQKENNLTQVDLLILQVLSKFKRSIEATNFTDVLFNTWSSFEFLTKAFTLGSDNKFSNEQKIDKIIEFIELIYSFVYTNEHHRWDLTNKKERSIIKSRANKLVVYAYFYRNQIVHGHLIENPFMISITRGFNIFLANLLGLIFEKIIFTPSFVMEDVFLQLQSDLKKQINNNEVQ